MKIKHSYFDYGGEFDICFTYQINDKPARLSVRRKGERYELYACPYFPSPLQEEILAQGTLEEVIHSSNTLMQEFMGQDWTPDVPERHDPG